MSLYEFLFNYLNVEYGLTTPAGVFPTLIESVVASLKTHPHFGQIRIKLNDSIESVHKPLRSILMMTVKKLLIERIKQDTPEHIALVFLEA